MIEETDEWEHNIKFVRRMEGKYCYLYLTIDNDFKIGIGFPTVERFERDGLLPLLMYKATRYLTRKTIEKLDTEDVG
jgi:hypothetical protein